MDIHNMECSGLPDGERPSGDERPGGGGGEILVTGTPEQVAKHKSSHTARFLKPLLANQKIAKDKKAK